MLFVALEYDYTSSGDEYDAETLENIVKEIDLEALKEEERIPLIKEQVREQPQSAEKLNVVDATTEEEAFVLEHLKSKDENLQSYPF